MHVLGYGIPNGEMALLAIGLIKNKTQTQLGIKKSLDYTDHDSATS